MLLTRFGTEARRPLAVGTLALMVFATACGTDRADRLSSGVAVEFVMGRSGGLCPSPEGGAICGLTVVIAEDGSWTASGSPPPEQDEGMVPAGSAAELVTIFDDGWEVLTARPFTGMCPTAYDGSEVTYSVRRLPIGDAAPFADADIREVRSCTHDLSHPAAGAVVGRLEQRWEALGLPR